MIHPVWEQYGEDPDRNQENSTVIPFDLLFSVASDQGEDWGEGKGMEGKEEMGAENKSISSRKEGDKMGYWWY